jgi:hypothetical protein
LVANGFRADQREDYAKLDARIRGEVQYGAISGANEDDGNRLRLGIISLGG